MFCYTFRHKAKSKRRSIINCLRTYMSFLTLQYKYNPIIMSTTYIKGGILMISYYEKIYDDITRYIEGLFSEYISCQAIMKSITFPGSVFKYRRFVDHSVETNEITDNPFWKTSLDGDFFFSTPSEFNSNDPDDCKLSFNEEKVIQNLYSPSPSALLQHQDKLNNLYTDLNQYKNDFNHNFRVGCFTTGDYRDPFMWQNEHFGLNHTGYCIQYKVDPNYFYPGTIVFLKNIYLERDYDATSLLYNMLKGNDIGKWTNDLLNPYACKGICLSYNPILIKNSSYSKEQEWRIIIPPNRYAEYFNDVNKGNATKDFGPIMKAVYLGKDYGIIDPTGEKYAYALEVCKKRNIPLYIMKESNNTLLREQIL